MFSRCQKAGFTLIEVLVVMAIIAVLASISIVGVQQVNKSSKNRETRLRLKALDEAIDRAYNDGVKLANTQKFPISDGKITDLNSVYRTLSGVDNSGEIVNPVYLAVLNITGSKKKWVINNQIVDSFRQPLQFLNLNGIIRPYSIGQNGQDEKGEGDDITAEE